MVVATAAIPVAQVDTLVMAVVVILAAQGLQALVAVAVAVPIVIVHAIVYAFTEEAAVLDC